MNEIRIPAFHGNVHPGYLLSFQVDTRRLLSHLQVFQEDLLKPQSDTNLGKVCLFCEVISLFRIRTYLPKVTASEHGHTLEVLQTELELLFFPKGQTNSSQSVFCMVALKGKTHNTSSDRQITIYFPSSHSTFSFVPLTQ